jgi:hypothetical protein
MTPTRCRECRLMLPVALPALANLVVELRRRCVCLDTAQRSSLIPQNMRYSGLLATPRLPAESQQSQMAVSHSQPSTLSAHNHAPIDRGTIKHQPKPRIKRPHLASTASSRSRGSTPRRTHPLTSSSLLPRLRGPWPRRCSPKHLAGRAGHAVSAHWAPFFGFPVICPLAR